MPPPDEDDDFSLPQREGDEEEVGLALSEPEDGAGFLSLQRDDEIIALSQPVEVTG